MEGFQAAAGLLPARLRQAAQSMPEGDRRRCEELRLRAGRPATALILDAEHPFSRERVTPDDLRAVLEAATRSSLHAAVDQLGRGYLSARGGVRVGVCGTAAAGPGGAEGFRDFSSMSLRVPRQLMGCADGIWPRLTAGGFVSTVIVSPPGAGKTTLLRELVRRLSDAGLRSAVADERGELFGFGPDGARFELGAHTDVMTGVPKARAVQMLLRAMNPQLIAMDEITDEPDARALLEAVGCGVRLLATVHGARPEDLSARPACRALMEAGGFSRCVVVENTGGARSYRVEDLT